MDLSVIIPTRDRADLLAKMLDGLRRQSFESRLSFEVIVVDNGSSDSTPDVIRDAAPYFANFSTIYEQTPGLHAGRHAGLRKSSSDILVFCDDDIVPEPTWLQGIADSFLIRGVAVATGPCRPEYQSAPPEWVEARRVTVEEGSLYYALSLIDLGDMAGFIPSHWAFGCNFAVRRDAVVRAGGFRPDSMPWDLIEYRGDGETGLAQVIATAGGKTYYNPDAAIRHWVASGRMTPEYIYRRAFAEGITTSFKITREAKELPPFPEIVAPLPRLPMPPDANDEIGLRQSRGTLDGFWFHQRRLRQNGRLLPWVLRRSFLGHEAIDAETPE